MHPSHGNWAWTGGATDSSPESPSTRMPPAERRSFCELLAWEWRHGRGTTYQGKLVGRRRGESFRRCGAGLLPLGLLGFLHAADVLAILLHGSELGRSPIVAVRERVAAATGRFAPRRTSGGRHFGRGQQTIQNGGGDGNLLAAHKTRAAGSRTEEGRKRQAVRRREDRTQHEGRADGARTQAGTLCAR